MPFHIESSRGRFGRYKRNLTKQRTAGVAEVAPSADSVIGTPGTRHRSFFRLLGEFFGLLGGLRGRLVFALATLTIATLLNLAPPAATKVLVDYVLIDNPVPAFLTDVLRLPADRRMLLGAVALAIIGISIVSVTVGMWGRWQATKTTKRLQVAVRRSVFEHAVRLPLHRVYALKSGGVVSILREDAGGVAELIFSMVYNPWRAIIQLAGTLAILTVSTATSGPAASTWTRTRRRPLAACGWCGPSAASGARRTASRATTTSWPGRSCTHGGGPAAWTSPGRC
jgi:ATP-binding cassette subfamily B protein/subfamily B ATP-binding cassette protein MsbA